MHLAQQESVFDLFDKIEPIVAPLLFTALAFFTRLYKIGLSDIVTWDEAQYVPLIALRWSVIC